MSVFRSILLNILVSGLVSGLVCFVYYERHNGEKNGAGSPNSSEPAGTAPSPPSDAEILSELREFVAYTDAQHSQDKRAYSDADIARMNGRAADHFISEAVSIISKEASPGAEDCFALGRVALLHGRLGVARLYLGKAAAKNFGAAYGYLADPKLSGSPILQWQNCTEAEKLGFAPARNWRIALEHRATAAIVRYTGDPQDRQLPQGQLGISSARIMALNTSDIYTLIEDYGFYARLNGSPAYLAYGLGRAAFLHQMYKTAREYLNLAMQKGSPAACAYLAYPEMTGDLNQRIGLLRKAAAGNYEPGERGLADALEMQRLMHP